MDRNEKNDMALAWIGDMIKHLFCFSFSFYPLLPKEDKNALTRMCALWLVLFFPLQFSECRRYGLRAPPDPSINLANEPSEETEALESNQEHTFGKRDQRSSSFQHQT